MADDKTQNLAGFVLGQEPVTSARTLQEEEPHDLAEPSPPLLWAIARNPCELLVCWSVTWRSVFEDDPPRDPKVLVRLNWSAGERTIEAEPTTGYVIIGELESGVCYGAELGYFNSAKEWRPIIDSPEVTMPSAESANREVEVALIPLHLSFQSIVNQMDGLPPGQLSSFLGRLQRSWPLPEKSDGTRESLESLGFFDRDLDSLARTRMALEKAPRQGKRRPRGGESGPSQRWSGGS